MRPATRSQTKIKSENLNIDPLDITDQSSFIDSNNLSDSSSSSESDREFEASIMSKLSLETTIKLIPQFNG